MCSSHEPGICYTAQTSMGAFIEAAARFQIIKYPELESRRMATMTLDRELRLADCLAPGGPASTSPPR